MGRLRRAIARAGRCRGVMGVLAAGVAAGTGCRGTDADAREAPSAGVDARHADAAIRSAMAAGAAWPSYGRDYSNQRWSPLGEITTANVARLAPAWIYHTGIVAGFETSPVVVDGVMYISTPRNHVVALDATTGAKRWEYVHPYRTTVDCCGPINRGVAVYGGRVFMGTVDARLVALDAASGRLLWDVSVGDNQQGYHITAAPLAVDGKVITGISCGEQGGRCYVTAYDAGTGKQVWRFYTIPDPAHGGWWGAWRARDPWGADFHRDLAQEHRDSATYPDAWRHGGGPMWHTPAVDTALGLVYLNIGNAAPDVDGRVRPGDNLFTDCIVAIDLKTGEYRWHYQEVSHDLWDYDPASPVVLVNVRDSTGRAVPAVAQAGKTGWVYVLDRRTGRPIRRSDAFVPQENMFTVPTEAGVVIAPSTLGGSDWSPPAYSPETGYLYVDGNYFPQLYRRQHEELQAPAQYWGGVVTSGQTGHYGTFSAVDLNTGRIAWQVRLAQPTISGALATAGGLVFTGLSDSAFVAYDARNGHEVWRYRARAGVNAPAVTYALNGRQYVAVAAGGNLPLNSARGDEVLVFALDGAGASGGPRTGASTGAEGGVGRAATARAMQDTARGSGEPAVNPVLGGKP